MTDNPSKLRDNDLMTPFIPSIVSNQLQSRAKNNFPIKDIAELSNSAIPLPPPQAKPIP